MTDTSIPEQQRPECPTPNKKVYRSQAEANRFERKFTRPGQPKERLYPYECACGEHWHLTHHKSETQMQVFGEAYGTASLDEYEHIRGIATKAIECERNRKLEQTFREDYEFYGANEGTVTVNYRGHCTECGYGIDIKEDHPIPGGES